MNPAQPVPNNEYERFLSTLPDDFREACRSRLAGSGLSPDHPIFQVLADLFEKRPAAKEVIPDFLAEAQLHLQLAKQLLADLQQVPTTILRQIEPQLQGLLAALTRPVEKLEIAATSLERNVEALPVLLLPKRFSPPPVSAKRWDQFTWRLEAFCRTLWSMIADHQAWIVIGSICLTLVITVLSLGASNLSQYYEQSYQKRLAHLEADSVENTITLNRLLIAGIALKVERNKEGDAYFLVLQGAHKAAPPVNSPEGLAVEVWP